MLVVLKIKAKDREVIKLYIYIEFKKLLSEEQCCERYMKAASNNLPKQGNLNNVRYC